VVDDAAGRADQNVDAVLERALLRRVGNSAMEEHRAHPVRRREHLAHLAHLQNKERKK